ncbi:hypothetical protein Tco_0400800, partial [Tanacetum coccineum]
LSLNKDNVFQDDQCDAFESDVDEAPTTQTMFMENLSSADPIYDEIGPSYDSDIISKVQDYDNYLDSVDEYQEYVKNNAEQVVQSNVSFVPNDALMMIINDMHDQAAQCVSVNEQNKVVNESLTVELARYKEQVVIYEKRTRELHSVKMQLNSTIDHNKLMKEEVATLKKDFKQKENKYIEDFLDRKALKEKVEDRLFKQDQSLQTVHMLCKPKPYYDEKKRVAIGYKNPLYLTSAMQVQSALYNGHEIVKTNYAPAVVHNSEDILKIAEITRKKINDKMKTCNVLSYYRFDVGLHEAMMSLGVGKLKDEVVCTLARRLTEVAAMADVLRFATLLSLIFVGVLSLPAQRRTGVGTGNKAKGRPRKWSWDCQTYGFRSSRVIYLTWVFILSSNDMDTNAFVVKKGAYGCILGSKHVAWL